MANPPTTVDPEASPRPPLWDGGEAGRWLSQLIEKRALLPCRTLLLSARLDEEARILCRSGFETIVVDPDPRALADLRRRLRGADRGLQTITGNVFALSPSFFGPVEFIVDRSFFHGLEPSARAAWAHTAGRIRPSGGHLGCLFLVGRGNQGPPYPITTDDIRFLLRRLFAIDTLEGGASGGPGQDRPYWGLFRRL